MLKLINVTKKYGNLLAVDHLSFDLNDGEILGIVGQNGAGKSTTFKMILDFIKPTSGNIYINGQPFSENSLRYIGFLPEERGLYLDMTVEQQVKYFADLHNYPKDKFKVNLDYWMKRLQVKGNIKTKIKKLSKGNQQKVQLICTLIHEPNLIILDEPFSGLDPVNIEILLDVVTELKNKNISVIFSSHNMQNVEKVSDKVLMLVNGQRKLYGNINNVKSNFLSKKVYVEGTFPTSYFYNFDGFLNYTDDYPGYILSFENHIQAVNCLKTIKKEDGTTGFRLLPLSLNDIFKEILSTN